MDDFEEIFEQIIEERAYQNTLWGDKFDDKNTINDWSVYIMTYLGYATRAGLSFGDQRRNMLKVASLAVAAIQTFDRNGRFSPRHYDE